MIIPVVLIFPSVPIPTPDNPVPSPKNDVAVIELIPEIFVAPSPIIFPFAFIFPETVSAPNVPTDVILV